MKPIQQHKDPQITNISFDNFTGSICIITPQSDNDEETKDLMLSSPHTNGGSDLFKPNHHLSIITQPVLGARSRKKDKTDSITNSRRSSLNDSPSLILPINRLEKYQYEKKTSHHESTDSGLDFSLSTNSSVQYPQQYTTIHRPLSALNEDSNIDDGFHDQHIRFPIVNNLGGRHHSLEKLINDNKQENSFSNEQEKLIKKSNNDSHLIKIESLHPLPPPPPIQQYRSLNDLTNQQKQNKPLRKKAKLNIIVEPSLPLSSSSHLNNEQIHSITRTTSSSSNQPTPRNQQIKPKAITPLDHYPNQEQIRAHINRSVIERQHPPYLSIPPRKGVIQQTIPFDASPSKVNNLLFRQPKKPTNVFHPNPNIQGGASTIQNLHITPSRHIKQTLPGLYNEEINDNRREKRRLNDINKWQENCQKEQVRTKNNQESLKRESRQDHIDHFLTSTPRHYYEHGHFKHDQSNDKEQNKNQRTYRSKPTEFVIQNKNRVINPNTDFESEYSSRNTIAPFQSRPKKLIRLSNIQNQTEQNSQFNQRPKSPIDSINNLLRTTRIQPMNIKNEGNRLSKVNLTQFNKAQETSNRFFQTKSPTSWSVISDHQQQYDQCESSSSSNDKLNRTYQLIIINEQQLLDGRHVIPAENFQHPILVDTASQTSSRHTYPFTCTADSNNMNDIRVNNSPRELLAPNNSEIIFNHRSCSSSSLDRFSPYDRFPLPLGKVTNAMEEDDISTNYDSDDGWSDDDSAELIYVDEQYITQKKKNISSSHRISQQENVLLQ